MQNKFEYIFNDKKHIIYTFQTKEESICILNIKRSNDDYLNRVFRALQQVCNLLNEETYLGLTVGVSNIHSEYNKIHLAYFEALSCLRYGDQTTSGFNLFLYNDVKDNSRLELSLEQDIEILQKIKSGNAQSVNTEIKSLFDKLYSNTSSVTEPFIYDILCMILKIEGMVDLEKHEVVKNKLRIDYFIPYIKDRKSLEQKITEVVTMVCDLTKVDQGSKDKEIADVAVKFIQKNYSDCNLCVDMICDYVHFSDVYLSRVLKKYYNRTTLDYISNYRMDVAKDLFKNTNFSINDISLKVGYTQVRTFNRTFKRYLNISPDEYRKSNIS